MTASSRAGWLDEGLQLLGEEGSQALRIERLCANVGLSKGSFYHHFGGMPGYRTALLEHVERVCTTRFIEAVEGAGPVEAAEKLWLLMNLVLTDKQLHHRLEVPLRAWAQQDPEVFETQRRIDGARVAYVRSLLVDHGLDRADATSLARMIYFVLIGGESVAPAASAAELRRCWDRILGPVLGARPRPTPGRRGGAA